MKRKYHKYETSIMCMFCDRVFEDRIVYESLLSIAFEDGYPVTRYHTIIIPKRHCETFFKLTIEELESINNALRILKDLYLEKDATITGWNIGYNCGESAGQTVDHAHCHLIPRRDGDMDDPTGGIRHVLPWMGNYKLWGDI